MAWVHGIAAFFLAALSGMGVGGGGLFVIYLSWVTHTPQLTAQGLNLLFFLCSAGAAVPIHLRKRQIVGWAVAILIAAGAVGVLVGTSLAERVNESLLRKTFGIMLIVSGILSLKDRKLTETHRARKEE